MPEPILLEARDPRVIRIAKALSEGCNGCSYASEDAHWLYEQYEVWGEADPKLGFGERRERAFADFIVMALGEKK